MLQVDAFIVVGNFFNEFHSQGRPGQCGQIGHKAFKQIIKRLWSFKYKMGKRTVLYKIYLFNRTARIFNNKLFV